MRGRTEEIIRADVALNVTRCRCGLEQHPESGAQALFATDLQRIKFRVYVIRQSSQSPI
jgi:hypothetical protein